MTQKKVFCIFFLIATVATSLLASDWTRLYRRTPTLQDQGMAQNTTTNLVSPTSTHRRTYVTTDSTPNDWRKNAAPANGNADKIKLLPTANELAASPPKQNKHRTRRKK